MLHFFFFGSMSYVTIEGLHKIHVIIHNENFIIHTSFFYYLTFYESSYNVQLTQFLINTLLSKKWNKKEQGNKYTKKFFWILKFNGGVLDIAECNILGIMRFCYGLIESVIVGDICLVLKFREEWNYPKHKGGQFLFLLQV